MYSVEHFSIHAMSEWQMRVLREVLDFCSFQGLGWRGVPFTWDNKQQGTSNVKARIDRALANASFRTLFGVLNTSVQQHGTIVLFLLS